MKERAIRTSKTKNLLLLATCLVFVTIGVMMVAEGHDVFWGWGNILFFGLGAGLFIRELLRSKPRLTINEQGILDQSLGVGLIRWADITDAYLVTVKHQPFLCLVLRDPDAYTAKLHPVRRFLSRANRAFGFTELSVNLSGLAGTKPEEIEALVRSHVSAAQSTTRAPTHANR